MPRKADDVPGGRPVPRPLETEVLKKFMKFDAGYAEKARDEYPDLVKPPPAIGSSGTGGVRWVGLNVDPCKAKWLAKCGIVRGQNADGSTTRPKLNVPDPNKGFDLGAAMNTAPLPYPHWKGDVHGPFDRPPPSRAPSRRTSTSLSRTQSCPATAKSVPATAQSHAKSLRSKRSSAYASVRTTSSIAEIVSDEVQRQLNNMSCHEHYLEQRLQMNPPVLKPAPTPSDLNELIYFGTSKELQGRHAYLDKRHRIMPQERNTEPQTSAAEVGWEVYKGKGNWVGKMLKRMEAPPDTLAIT